MAQDGANSRGAAAAWPLPRLPRTIPDFAFIPIHDGMLVEGGPEPVVLRGGAVRFLLPQLLARMDGSRDLDVLYTALSDSSASAIKHAVGLLFDRGLLEDAACDPIQAPDVPAEIVAYFRRNLAATKVNRSGLEAAARLSKLLVVVAGTPAIAGQLERALVGHGMQVSQCWTGIDRLPARPDLVIAVALGEEDLSALQSLDDELGRAGIPWLRTSLRGSVAEIGPLFRSRFTCCYGCFASQHGVAEPTTPIDDHVQAWISLVAIEAVAIGCQISEPVTARDLLQIDLNTWRQRRLRFAKAPGCPVCGGGSQRSKLSVAVAYEQAIAAPSKAFLNPRQSELHRAPANLDLARDQKHYWAAPKIQLPPVRRLNALASRPVQGLDLLRLAAVLSRSLGYRDPARLRRWAPTAGNLGSTQAYIYATNVESLNEGWYFYEARQHRLARLHSRDRGDLDFAIDRATGSFLKSRPAAVLVFTAALHRLQLKYGWLAYHLALLDVGVAVAQLEAVCRCLALGSQSVPDWTDRPLLEALSLNPQLEPITAMVTIGIDSGA